MGNGQMVVAGANWTVRLWRRTSLMQRLAFIALVPTLVTAALLVVMLTRYQLNTLRGMAQSTADASATQAASVSADAIRNMQRRDLKRIAESVGNLPHVVHVQIRAADGEILADSHGDAAPRRREGRPVGRAVKAAPQPLQPALGSVLIDLSLGEAIAAQRASL